MWTITITATTLVAAVTVSSVELDKYRYHSTAMFLLYAVSRVPPKVRGETKKEIFTNRKFPKISLKLQLGKWGFPAIRLSFT